MTVDWIRAGLKHTGKTRSGLAKALGRSPSAVTDLLNGHRRLRADEIAIVAEFLGIEPPRLLGGGSRPMPEDARVIRTEPRPFTLADMAGSQRSVSLLEGRALQGPSR